MSAPVPYFDLIRQMPNAFDYRLPIGGRAPKPLPQLRRPLWEETYVGET